MKLTPAGKHALIGLIALPLALLAENKDQANSGSSSPLRPVDSPDPNATTNPGILAGERKAQFDRLDADKNGSLNQDEFMRISALARRIGSGIGTAGVNTPQVEGNPMIPTGDLPQLMKEVDANKDGMLTLEEFINIPLSKSGSALESVNTDNANISRSTGATVGRPSLGNLDRAPLFHRLDKNEDGRLDATEFGKMTGTELPSQDYAGTFHQLDLDGNGKISKEEFRKLPEGPSTPPKVTR